VIKKQVSHSGSPVFLYSSFLIDTHPDNLNLFSESDIRCSVDREAAARFISGLFYFHDTGG